MKTSYVHVQTPYGRSLGFSAQITTIDGGMDQNRNEKGDVMCYIAITFCNRKDKHFCKKTARDELETKPEEWVRCRDVPSILAEAAHRCDKHNSLRETRFNYVLRRFL